MKRLSPSSQLRRQYEVVRGDKWLLSSLTWIPVLLALSIWWIFSQGIAHNLPIGVVDLNHSQLSRSLTNHLEATSTLTVSGNYTDVLSAKEALVEGDIYAYVVIPSNLDKDAVQSKTPQVSVFYNSQYILVGKLVNSAVLQTHGTFNAKIEAKKNLLKRNTASLSAMGKAVPVRTQITALFNKGSNYAQFLVSAVVPALWQISIVVSTILILAANHRRFGLRHWLGQNTTSNLLLTLSNYIPIFLLQGIGFLIWFYKILDWPMNGSFAVLIFAQLLTVLACVAMGCFFFFLTLDAARAMSFAGAFTAPSFAFMGITFPVTDMNTLAQIWRSLLPISHYIEVQVSQASYGISALSSTQNLIPMLGYLVPMGVCLALVQKHMKTDLHTRVTS